MNKTAYAAAKARLAMGLEPTFEDLCLLYKHDALEVNAKGNNHHGWITPIIPPHPHWPKSLDFRLK